MLWEVVAVTYPEIERAMKAEEIYLDTLIEKCSLLQEKLAKRPTFKEKLDFLRSQALSKEFAHLNPFLNEASPEAQYVLLSLIVIDQAPIVFNGCEDIVDQYEAFKSLLNELLSLERFYQALGGIIGYHKKVLELMRASLTDNCKDEDIHYFVPPNIDLRQSTEDLQQTIIEGIKAQKSMAELYAVGGAGDRLNLIDEKTGHPLPAAELLFCNRTLFEGLIRDLQAREYLYYKLFHEQLCTPIVLMTSHEKQNDAKIVSICEEANWFGRPQESFFRIIQPLTPVIAIDGNWAMQAPLKPYLKPGGHGVIWKLAMDEGAFDWLIDQKRDALLVRQINNPLAGLDYGLLALSGYGVKNKMAFGFATVPRKKNASEGMIALSEKKGQRTITNIEYTDFAKVKHAENLCSEKTSVGVGDIDQFPANTNILFARIEEIKKAVRILPIPGMIVNMKLKLRTLRENGYPELQGARLESTMQNIADAMCTPVSEPLKVFVTLNDRQKTISVAKKSYEVGGKLDETPEGAFYDLIMANCILLKNACGMQLPSLESAEQSQQQYLKEGPSPLFLYHPALGPLYSIISQKIHGGKLSANSELQLEIAEVLMKNLILDGSLLVHANRVMGKKDPESQLLHFSDQVGRLHLENVEVINEGIDRSSSNCYWKGQIKRKEALNIILEGHSEFYAKDVCLRGNQEFRVPDGMRAEAKMKKNGEVEIIFTPL